MADRLGGAHLGGMDAGFQLLEEFGVTGGGLKSVCHLATQFIRHGRYSSRQLALSWMISQVANLFLTLIDKLMFCSEMWP